MNLLNRLIIKNLKLNKKRTIVTIVGIMLSVALITAVASIYASGINALIEYELREKGAFHVAFFNMPVEEAKDLENNRIIDTISLVQNIGYAEIDSQNEYKPYVSVKGFTDTSLENLSVKLIEGRFPENENEILIPSHLKTNGRVTLEIGETVTLEVGRRISDSGKGLDQKSPLSVSADENGEETRAERLTDTVSKTYEIVGIIERPASNIESYDAPGYTLITRVDESSLQGNVDVYIHFTKGGAKNAFKSTCAILGINTELFQKYYEENSLTSEELSECLIELSKVRSAFDFNYYLIMLESNPLEISGINTLSYAVYTVIAIIVLTSIFCIKNSFDISISEKIRQYGMLRSIGATKRQIRKNVFFEATILGAFGIPLGMVLGFIATYILTLISNYFMKDLYNGDEVRLSFVFSGWAVLAAVLLGFVTVYFSAFRSAVKASKVTPLESIRNSASITIGTKNLRVPGIIRKIFGIGGEISWKNLKRNKKKYRTTVISIIVSVVVFIALSQFMNLAFGVVEDQTEQTEYNLKLNATYETAEEYRMLVETTHFDHVQESAILRSVGIELTENHFSNEYLDWVGLNRDDIGVNYITILSLGDEQFATYCSFLGLNIDHMKEKGILVDYDIEYHYDETGKETAKYMRMFDYGKGDIVEGTTEKSQSGNAITSAIEIAAITETKPFGFKNWGGAFLFVSDDLFDKIAETCWVEILYRSDNSDKLQDAIEAYLPENVMDGMINSDEEYRQMNNLFILVGIFLYGFIIVISLIGITSIFNTITTNMELRKPEFAMLRSVGMTNKEFNRMIRLESLFIGIRALIIGIPIGILLSYLLYHFMAEVTGMPFRVPVTAIVIAVAAVFILIFLIMTYSLGKIRKQNTIETIRNENI